MIEVSKPSFTSLEYEMVKSTLFSGWIGQGKNVAEFEQKCKQIIGCKHFIALSTCTKAIEIALLLSGCKAGDGVLIPSLTYASVIHMLLRLGLHPVFVDVDERTLNIDISEVKRLIGRENIRFIIPVHFRGVICDIEELQKLASDHNVYVIEDAAHAFGSKRHGKSAGADSYATCFSFGPLKNISCLEGGGIATNSDDLANALITYRNLGAPLSTWERFGTNKFLETSPPGLIIEGPGDKCAMNDVAAAVGLAQIKRLESIRQKRNQLLITYIDELSKINGIQLPEVDIQNDYIYIFPVLVDPSLRTKLMNFLNKNQIRSAIHYQPNHLQPAFRKCLKGNLSKTEYLGSAILTLPFYTDLTVDEQQHIIVQLRNFFSNN